MCCCPCSFFKQTRPFATRGQHDLIAALVRYLDPLQGAEPAETAAEDRQDLLEVLASVKCDSQNSVILTERTVLFGKLGFVLIVAWQEIDQNEV